MPDRLFPRWCGALFALLPLSEILYLPAAAQSLYAAAAACAAAGLLAAGAARLSGAVAARPGVQLLLALAALFPLVCSLSRMSSFLRATVFTRVPLWVLCLALTLCALAHALSGLNVCAMWALPAVFLAGAVAVLSGVLTGMPSPAVLPGMMVECGVYGLVSGLMMQLVHTKKLYADLYISQITAMLLGRILSGVCKALIFAPATFTVAAWATTSFVTGLPGIVIQLVLLPTLVVALTKARLLRVRYA